MAMLFFLIASALAKQPVKEGVNKARRLQVWARDKMIQPQRGDSNDWLGKNRTCFVDAV
jgi:hypothetical protein